MEQDQAGVELFYGVTAGMPYIYMPDICEYKRVMFSQNNNKINEKQENKIIEIHLSLGIINYVMSRKFTTALLQIQ